MFHITSLFCTQREQQKRRRFNTNIKFLIAPHVKPPTAAGGGGDSGSCSSSSSSRGARRGENSAVAGQSEALPLYLLYTFAMCNLVLSPSVEHSLVVCVAVAVVVYVSIHQMPLDVPRA